MQNLPGCVRCVVHALVLAVQLAALPLTLFVAACQHVLIADAFASAENVPREQLAELHTRLVWHALAWPVRLIVAVALLPGSLAPMVGAGYGVWWAAGESVAAGIAGGVAALLVSLVGGNEIHKRSMACHTECRLYAPTREATAMAVATVSISCSTMHVHVMLDRSVSPGSLSGHSFSSILSSELRTGSHQPC